MSPEGTGNHVPRAGKDGGVEMAIGAWMAKRSAEIRSQTEKINGGIKTGKTATDAARAENGVIAIGARGHLQKASLF